jgi:hypothetical protein
MNAASLIVSSIEVGVNVTVCNKEQPLNAEGPPKLVTILPIVTDISALGLGTVGNEGLEPRVAVLDS